MTPKMLFPFNLQCCGLINSQKQHFLVDCTQQLNKRVSFTSFSIQLSSSAIIALLRSSLFCCKSIIDLQQKRLNLSRNESKMEQSQYTDFTLLRGPSGCPLEVFRGPGLKM